MPRVGGPWWGLLLAAACDSSFPPVLQSSTAGDSGFAPDSGMSGTDASRSQIDIPASNGSWQADADVTLDGSGAGNLAAIHVVHGIGTLSFAGTEASVFYLAAAPVPMGTSGSDSGLAMERDLELIAIQPGRIILAWITCDAADLAYLYYETTDGIASAASMRTSGTCSVVAQPVSELVAIPATTIATPRVVSGFTISGQLLSFDGNGPGQATFGGARWGTYPFHAIDCTSCAAQGWYELHTLFTDAAGQAACVGVLYLWPSVPTTIELAFPVCFPSIASPVPSGQMFAASWTKS